MLNSSKIIFVFIQSNLAILSPSVYTDLCILSILPFIYMSHYFKSNSLKIR